MQQQAEREATKEAIEFVFSLYRYKARPGQIAAYVEALSKFEPADIRRAVAKVPSLFPQGAPNAGELVEMVSRIAREKPRGAVIAAEPSTYKDHDLPVGNPYQLLAEKWQRESAEMGLNPDEPAPLAVVKQRCREINELFGGKVIAP